MGSKKLEICIDSIESGVAAHEGGAHRIELCSALEVGGLTPTVGLLKQIQHLCPSMTIYAMIRPRSGDFCYDSNEIQIMQKDIQVLKSEGVNGFVFGVLKTDGTVDYKNCQLLIETASPLDCTFHRAFDVVNDANKALEEVIKLGFTRILTSGQSKTAIDGLDNISNLVVRAQNRIIIMAGAGVTEDNMQLILSKTNINEIHSSASCVKKSQMSFRNTNVSMGSNVENEYNIKVTSTQRVNKMIDILVKNY
ncbi:copper homeostasis protein cutC homolog [Oppia nitens]|uniref:copper homeostasis protein cutC homolog n=1 Tax=Oppia nitens TaxID=1686743 RepID=UPI0023DBDBFF|nr:copper homeostasis protein cutC homolog [Oppia nitens]